ncbi:MAG: class I SAM-dependent methyltransferase [Chloroflexales bacterium]|nr:class I SAM-dependent methyltransferase [Chloroflexales bacterium]
MTATSEVERLRAVYRGYRDSDAVRARWAQDNPGNQAISCERLASIRGALGAAGLLPLTGRTVLEVGCGSGSILASMRQMGAASADLIGVDLLPDRVALAGKRYPDMAFLTGNAEALPFPDERFDLVLLFTVFSSILDQAMAANVAAEVRRVLRPGGAVLWYDFRFNNPRNPHVRGVSRQSIQALFPAFELHLQTITLLPPLARRLGAATPLLYPPFAGVPLLRTHHLGLLVKG